MIPSQDKIKCCKCYKIMELDKGDTVFICVCVNLSLATCIKCAGTPCPVCKKQRTKKFNKHSTSQTHKNRQQIQNKFVVSNQNNTFSREQYNLMIPNRKIINQTKQSQFTSQNFPFKKNLPKQSVSIPDKLIIQCIQCQRTILNQYQQFDHQIPLCKSCSNQIKRNQNDFKKNNEAKDKMFTVKQQNNNEKIDNRKIQIHNPKDHCISFVNMNKIEKQTSESSKCAQNMLTQQTVTQSIINLQTLKQKQVKQRSKVSSLKLNHYQIQNLKLQKSNNFLKLQAQNILDNKQQNKNIYDNNKVNTMNRLFISPSRIQQSIQLSRWDRQRKYSVQEFIDQNILQISLEVDNSSVSKNEFSKKEFYEQDKERQLNFCMRCNYQIPKNCGLVFRQNQFQSANGLIQTQDFIFFCNVCCYLQS